MISLPRIIGLGYRAYVGKDTLANYLVARYGYRKASFAGPLKALCKDLFGLTDEHVNGARKEERLDYWSEKLGFDVTPRYLQQVVGTELFRKKLHMDFWVFLLEQRLQNTPAAYVIPDVRFPNEAQAIKSLGGVLWNLQRDCTKAVEGVPLHESEIALDSYTHWDAIIDNNSTFVSLFARARSMLGDADDTPTGSR